MEVRTSEPLPWVLRVDRRLPGEPPRVPDAEPQRQRARVFGVARGPKRRSARVAEFSGVGVGKMASPKAGIHMAMGQHQWYHFGALGKKAQKVRGGVLGEKG